VSVSHLLLRDAEHGVYGLDFDAEAAGDQVAVGPEGVELQGQQIGPRQQVDEVDVIHCREATDWRRFAPE